jgi:hypothetical protein
MAVKLCSQLWSRRVLTYSGLGLRAGGVGEDTLYTIPLADGQAGDLAKSLTDTIFDIQVRCFVTLILVLRCLI